jgi:hypothetical protein
MDSKEATRVGNKPVAHLADANGKGTRSQSCQTALNALNARAALAKSYERVTNRISFGLEPVIRPFQVDAVGCPKIIGITGRSSSRRILRPFPRNVGAFAPINLPRRQFGEATGKAARRSAKRLAVRHWRLEIQGRSGTDPRGNQHRGQRQPMAQSVVFHQLSQFCCQGAVMLNRFIAVAWSHEIPDHQAFSCPRGAQDKRQP